MALTMEQHIEQFKEQGFTIFPSLFPREQMDQWKAKFVAMQAEGANGNVHTWWYGDMLELAPTLMLPAVTQPVLMQFAERILGPFVQLDNLTLAGFPSMTKAEAAGKTAGWHRDRWGKLPTHGEYDRPNAINAICYLQDLTDETGPLRVIPGSHRQPIAIDPVESSKPHPREQLCYLKAGDVVVIYNNLLHSGTPNVSGQTRYFFSIYYNLSWLRHTDNHKGPQTLRILAEARLRNDHRLMRLLGVDEHLDKRANSGFRNDDETNWKKWLEEDKAAIKPPST